MQKYFTPFNVVLALVVAYVVWKQWDYNRKAKQFE